MIWIILIAIILLVIFGINKDYKENVTRNVTNYGGMRVKYAELISYLNQGAKVSKETKDSIRLNSSSMTWYIDLVGDDIEIRMSGYMPLLGNVSHKWIYPHNYSQSKMIQDIENYMDWQLGEFYKQIENDPRNNLNL